jgi:hypothetical protein
MERLRRKKLSEKVYGAAMAADAGLIPGREGNGGIERVAPSVTETRWSQGRMSEDLAMVATGPTAVVVVRDGGLQYGGVCDCEARQESILGAWLQD